MNQPLQEDIEFLEHFGVRGMHWGVRRDSKTGIRPIAKALNDSAFGRKAQRNLDKHNARLNAETSQQRTKRHQRNKKLLIGGAVAVGTLLAVHGAKKLSDKNFQRSMEKFGREGVATWYQGSTPIFMRDING